LNTGLQKSKKDQVYDDINISCLGMPCPEISEPHSLKILPEK